MKTHLMIVASLVIAAIASSVAETRLLGSNEATSLRHHRPAPADRTLVGKFLNAAVLAKCAHSKDGGPADVAAKCKGVMPGPAKAAGVGFTEKIEGRAKATFSVYSADPMNPKGEIVLHVESKGPAPLNKADFEAAVDLTVPAGPRAAPCEGCKVLKFANDVYSSIDPPSIDKLKRALKCKSGAPQTTVVAEGAFGAVAALLARELAAGGCKLQLGTINSPKVGNQAFTDSLAASVPTVSILVDRPVPGNMAGFPTRGPATARTIRHPGSIFVVKDPTRLEEALAGGACPNPAMTLTAPGAAPVPRCEVGVQSGPSPPKGVLTDLAVKQY